MIYVIMYLVAIVLANLTVAAFGPSVVILNAFLFIGLDLTARDKLHDGWSNNHLESKMFVLIVSGSFLSWILNKDAAQIAIASMVSFFIAATIDTVTYNLLINKKKLVKMNGSNIPSALADSIMFPTIAFGTIIPSIIIGQFLAKVIGGLFWSIVITKIMEKRTSEAQIST